MLLKGARILVADGEKALFLENRGDPDLPDLRIIDVDRQTLKRPGEIYSDDEGRRIDHSSLGQRSAMERTDYKRIEKARFAAEIVETLQAAHRAKKFSALYVFAPPRVLGALRDAMDKELAAAVQAEFDKNFTGEPAETLQGRLLETLQAA